MSDSSRTTTFKTRFGLIVSLLGMAVGTGNIWRFPRVMAANGGGAFLVPWFLFLFLWSIPLLVVEFSLGKKLRSGVTHAFAKPTNGQYTWLGGFVVFCTLAIMFYYSVVTGWCLHYLGRSLTGQVLVMDPETYWNHFLTVSPEPVFYHAVSILLTMGIAWRGIQKGIELANSIMMPLLCVMMLVLLGFAMSFPGKEAGLAFIFNTDFSRLADYRVWLEGLTQSAWSTGAGWGIALTYAAYARAHDDEILTPVTTGLGNNSVELIAGMVVIPTLFSFFPLEKVLELTQSGNTGLTFIALPGLFKQMPAGQIFAVLFFASLFFAAFTSLFAMFELGIGFLKDLGMTRGRAIVVLGAAGFLVGLPSAVSRRFFDNQDWVWGIGLLVSGFFFSLLVHRIGGRTFFEDYAGLRKGWVRTSLEWLILWLVPFEFLALLFWWFSQSVSWNPRNWWNPFYELSLGTCLVQWGAALAVLYALNRLINSRINRA